MSGVIHQPRAKTRSNRVISNSVKESSSVVKWNWDESSVVRSSRKKEKQEMQELNTRLAHYIEVCRYKDALNKDLEDEIENLRSMGERESIKSMYEAEMKQLRKLLDEAELEKAELGSEKKRKEGELEEMREGNLQLERTNADNEERLGKQEEDLAMSEAQLAALRRKCDNLEEDKKRERSWLERLRGEIASLRNEVSAERVGRIDSQNQCQTLREEIEFMRDLHKQELKDLGRRSGKSREWWSREFSDCIREIQAEYDERMRSIKEELESGYNLRMGEVEVVKTESAQLRDQVNGVRSTNSELRIQVGRLETENQSLILQNDQLRRQLADFELDYDKMLVENDGEMGEIRAHLENTLSQLQSLTDTNLSLQLEIIAYRKLLEGEENRLAECRTSDEETTSKTTYQRSAKGPISILQTDVAFIEIENTNIAGSEDLTGWKMLQFSDDLVWEYLFPEYVLPGGATFRVWANGGHTLHPSDLLWTDRTSLSTGAVVTTSLLNPQADERATFTLKNIFVNH